MSRRRTAQTARTAEAPLATERPADALRDLARDAGT